jgi:hypothetical protein
MLLVMLLAGRPLGAFAQGPAEPGLLSLDAPGSRAGDGLPRRFRTSAFPLLIPAGAATPSRLGLDSLRLSGSSQFSLPELAALRQQLPPRAVLIDLRRESHGFLGPDAVSWRLPDNQGNAGLDAAAVSAAETALLVGIDDKPDLTVAREAKRGGPTPLVLGPLGAITEAEAAAALGLGYFRLAVSDHTRPDTNAVDRFVRFYRRLAPDVWLHFHCRGGAGRTTTFMSLVDMLQNAGAVSFEDIITRQKALGGTDLAKTGSDSGPGREALARERLAFLRQFYDYARANPGGGPRGYGEWLAGGGRN